MSRRVCCSESQWRLVVVVVIVVVVRRVVAGDALEGQGFVQPSHAIRVHEALHSFEDLDLLFMPPVGRLQQALQPRLRHDM